MLLLFLNPLRRIRWGLLAALICGIPAVGQSPAPAPSATLPVARAYTADVSTRSAKLLERAEIGHTIELRVPGFRLPPNKSAADLVLFINGLPMAGLHPSNANIPKPAAPMPAQGAAKVVDGKPGEVAKSRVLPTDTSTFQFVLVREGATLKAWERFYRHPRFNEYNIQYSLGLPDQELTQRTKGTTLELVRQRRITFIWLVTALVFIGLIWLAIRTDIIKDQSTHEKRPYSLARTQIAWWTLVVLAAFLHLYVYTNEMPTLTDATLVLLGISAGTFAGARLVDQSQAEAQRHQSTVGSRGFFYDLMSDGSDRYNSGRNGISVHRFQLLIWTLVLTILFLRYTLRNLDMPKFDDNLLLLMGISNGTYLLLKIPENAQPATEVPAAPLHAQQPTANMNAAGAGATTISQRPAEDDNGPTADLPANVDLDPNAASNPNNGVG